MMNKFIIDQLKKCKTKLPDWDETTTEIIISNKTVGNIPYKSGNFNIQIENYIINEPDNFTLSSNWNNGTKPPEQYMTIDIINQNGKMYKVAGVGATTSIYWEGWLPEKGFKII